MIYNDKFVWLHFPKCAGTKVENIFETYFKNTPGIHIDPVGLEKDSTVGWHDSIQDRENKDLNFKLGNRDIILPIRQLAPWLVSRYCFEVKRNPNLQHDKMKLLEAKFLEFDGNENRADFYMKKYLPENILKSNRVRFLRTEFFESDFKSIFSDYLDLSVIPEDAYSTALNVSEKCLNPEFIDNMNNNNFKKAAPYWLKIEKIAYTNKSNKVISFFRNFFNMER